MCGGGGDGGICVCMHAKGIVKGQGWVVSVGGECER